MLEVERAGEKGWLKGATVLLATDNEVVEVATYKGNSTSKKLYNLVLRLKMVEMKYGCHLIVTHVTETRISNRALMGCLEVRYAKGWRWDGAC